MRNSPEGVRDAIRTFPEKNGKPPWFGNFPVLPCPNQGPTQLGPIQKRSQGDFLSFFAFSSHEAAVLPSAIVAKDMCTFHSNEFLSPENFDLDGCFSGERP